MRVLSLLLVAACGSVKTPSLADAGAGDSPADASIDAPPDAPGPCPVEIRIPAPPSWRTRGPFVQAADPAGSGAQVWASSGSTIAAASFSVPFRAGDRLTGLTFAAYGNGNIAGGGLQHIQVIYQPDALSSWQILAMGEDLNRDSQWGQVELQVPPTVLDVGAICWVQFGVTEPGYYIGMVTPIFERPCPSK